MDNTPSEVHGRNFSQWSARKAWGVAPSRTETRSVACPACGATAGTLCQSRRGDRETNHAERVYAFMDSVK